MSRECELRTSPPRRQRGGAKVKVPSPFTGRGFRGGVKNVTPIFSISANITMTTVRQAWIAARDRLTVSPSASLDAQVLLADILGVDNRAYLMAYPERVLTPGEVHSL